MRDFRKIIAHVQRWEGGYVNDPDDAGGETNKGVTYKTWISIFGKGEKERFKRMNYKDWLAVYLKYYKAMRGDEIKSEAVAYFATQMMWGSGEKAATILLQEACVALGKKIEIDGDFGSETLKAINSLPERDLFDQLVIERVEFFKAIVKKRPKNAKFYKGWIRRLEDFRVTFRPKLGK